MSHRKPIAVAAVVALLIGLIIVIRTASFSEDGASQGDSILTRSPQDHDSTPTGNKAHVEETEDVILENTPTDADLDRTLPADAHEGVGLRRAYMGQFYG